MNEEINYLRINSVIKLVTPIKNAGRFVRDDELLDLGSLFLEDSSEF